MLDRVGVHWRGVPITVEEAADVWQGKGCSTLKVGEEGGGAE